MAFSQCSIIEDLFIGIFGKQFSEDDLIIQDLDNKIDAGLFSYKKSENNL